MRRRLGSCLRASSTISMTFTSWGYGRLAERSSRLLIRLERLPSGCGGILKSLGHCRFSGPTFRPSDLAPARRPVPIVKIIAAFGRAEPLAIAGLSSLNPAAIAGEGKPSGLCLGDHLVMTISLGRIARGQHFFDLCGPTALSFQHRIFTREAPHPTISSERASS